MRVAEAGRVIESYSLSRGRRMSGGLSSARCIRGQAGSPGMLARALQMLGLVCTAMVAVALAGCGGQPVTTHLSGLSQGTGTFQSGQAVTLLLPGGFPGLPTAAQTKVVIAPVAGGTSTTLTVTSIAASGSNYTLAVTLPTLDLTAATAYNFTASGMTTTGSFDTTPVSITIQPGSKIASLSPATGQAGQTLDVTLTGLATAFVNGTTTATFGAGISVGGAASGAAGPLTVTNGTSAVAHLVIDPAAAAGTRDVTVVTGTQSLTLTAGFTVTAAPKAPVASAGGPYAATTGTAVTLTAAGSSDPAGLTLSYAWAFGDGGTGTGVAPAHTYATAGTYTATVTVTNSAGVASAATAVVTVKDAAKAPVANAGGPYTGTAGTAVTFTAGASSDPAGLALTYAWSFGDGGTATGVSPTHTYASAGTYTVSVTATNSASLTNAATTTATIKAAPQAPVASVGGPYSGTAGAAVTFTAGASTDPAGLTLTYAWSFGDGGTATGVSPTHTYASAGTYTVSVTVTNSASLTNAATTTATIKVAPQAPVASVGGPYSGTAGTTVSFTGAGSTDPQNETLSYAWTFGDGGTATGVAPTHTYAAAGTFTVTVTVTNTDNLSATKSTTATIAAAPLPPVVSAGGPYTGTAGAAVSFSSAGSSDPSGKALTYSWDFGDASAKGTTASPTHTYASAGTFTVTLTVTSAAGLSSTATSTATIAAAPVPPVANAGGPYTGTAETAVSLSGAASSDPRGEVLTYSWDFGDGSAKATTVSPSHIYAAAGTYTVTLTVTNSDALSASKSTTATIAAPPAQPPVAVVGGPYTGTTGTAVSFTATGSSDPKSEVLTYSWDFGDGTAKGSGAVVTHTYVAAGTFTVTLTVTNTDSLTGSATTKATITQAAQAPVASAGGPYSGIAGTGVSFSGAGSTDPKSEVLTYAWSFGDGGSATGVSPTHTYAAAGTYTVTLTVKNTDNLQSTATSTATIAVAPQPPVARAGGPYTGVAGTAVSFSGASSSDPKSEPLTYAWAFGDGGTATGVSPTHNYVTAGSYTATLTVTNTDGLSASASAAVTVTAPANPPPVANAGSSYTGVAGTAVSFSGAGSSDPRGETLSYAWTFGDGGTATGVAPTHAYAVAGTYTVTLTVTNTDNLSATASTTATIGAVVAQPPTANVGGPYTGVTGTAVSFAGASSSDPRGETLSYAWTFGDGGTAAVVSPTHTYSAAGTYTVTLTVTNTDGLSATASTTATITAAPQAPVAKVGGPYTGVMGAAVSFTGAASSDPKSETLSYAWNFGDGATGVGVSPTHTYSAAGTFTVTLTVTNTDGLSATASTTATITAAPQPPVARAGGPYTGTTAAAVSFSAAASTDPKGETLSYAWAFGDGGTATGVSPTHSYTAAGTYTVTVTATNTDGLSATASTTATIALPAAQPPVPNAGGPYSGTAGTVVSFSAAASTDPKGEALTFAWSFGDGSVATGVAPTHTYVSAGTYTVSLMATNTDSASATVSTTATIAAVPAQAPVANPGGPYTGAAGSGVSVNGLNSKDPSSSNPSATLTFVWSFGDGGMGSGPTPIHTYAAAGTYTITLTVTNQQNLSSTATTTVVVAVAPPISGSVPTVNAGGPYSGTAGAAISLSGSGTDASGATLTYTWNFGDGSSADGAVQSHAYVSAGTYSAILTVNNGTNVATASAIVTVAAGPSAGPPVANAGGPYTASINLPVRLDASRTTNPATRLLTFAWDFGDGSQGSSATPAHTYTAQGTYTVHLTVTDGLGGSSNATAQMTVGGPPAETVQANAGGPYNDIAGHAIVFDATGSTDNLSNSLAYAWDFGDGSTATGATPTHAYTNTGTFTVKVTVSSNGISSTASGVVTITPALNVVITSPKAAALFGTNTITVSGTVSAANLAVTVNGIAATVNGTSFTAAGVSLREGVNLITASVADTHGGVGSGSVSVVLDATPPTISVTSPVSNATVSTSTITVAGLVNDIVSGTIGGTDVSVTVNGIAANVANRSYSAANILLVPGANTISVAATDKVGHVTTMSTTVNYVPPSRQLSLAILSGNGQSAVVSTVLPQPLVVQLLAADGTPVTGRPVTFTVTRSDGQVEVMPTIAQSLYVTTDGLGKASVLFQLGARTGLGVNQVTASTPGAAGTVLFTEDSVAQPASQIHAVRGEAQRGLLGEALAEGFQVIVQDAGGNPIPGTTVNFAVTSGDGTLSAASVATDSDGKAMTQLTLGQQEGINNYAVSATFAGNANSPAIFTASAYAPGPVASTSVSGVVLDNANTPIPNATVRLQGTTLSTVSDLQGRFTIASAPVGIVTLSVDGSTSTRTETFPFLSFVLNDLPGQNNTLNKPIYLPAINVNSAQTVGGDDPVTLTMDGVPGVAFTIAPHSVVFPDGTTVGKLSISQVKTDMVPMPPTNGTGPDLIWTLQPAGTRFSVPVQVTLPNTQHLAPGTVSEMYQYDHDLEQFVSAGTAHVSADGSVILSDPGFGITKAGWGHGPTTPNPPNCTVSCQAHFSACLGSKQVNCGCELVFYPGAVCGNDAETKKCNYPGTCNGYGFCITPAHKPDGSNCGPDSFCTTQECRSGICTAITVPDKPQGLGPIGNQGAKFELTLGEVSSSIGKVLETFGLPVIIKPKFSGQVQDTLTCCEATRQSDVLISKGTDTGGINVATNELPLWVPTPAGPVKAGFNIPRLGFQGLFAKFEGDLTGSVSHTINNCTKQDCFEGGAGIAVAGTLGLKFGVDEKVFKFELTAQTGFSGSLTAGCGSMKSSIKFSGITATVQVTFLDLFTASVPYQGLDGTISEAEYKY